MPLGETQSSGAGRACRPSITNADRSRGHLSTEVGARQPLMGALWWPWSSVKLLSSAVWEETGWLLLV